MTLTDWWSFQKRQTNSLQMVNEIICYEAKAGTTKTWQYLINRCIQLKENIVGHKMKICLSRSEGFFHNLSSTEKQVHSKHGQFSWQNYSIQQ